MSRRTGVLALAAATSVAVACASGVQTGPPLPDPGAAARRAADFPVERQPTLLRFEWEYADERGNVEGDGAARANPPDSLRVDLFSSGDVSLAAALASGRLTTVGQVEDVELPSPAFLYAMAGLFRPAAGGPEEAFRTDRGLLLLRYRTNGGLRREYLIDDGRLLRLEDRRDGRLLRRVTVQWDSGGAWPASAEYRSTVEPRRVRWQVRDVELRQLPFEPEIYDLPRETVSGRLRTAAPGPPPGFRGLRVRILRGRRAPRARQHRGHTSHPERDLAVRAGGRVHEPAHGCDDGAARGTARRRESGGRDCQGHHHRIR